MHICSYLHKDNFVICLAEQVRDQNSVHIQYSNPSPQLVKIPYRITGPAIVKILHPMPNT